MAVSFVHWFYIFYAIQLTQQYIYTHTHTYIFTHAIPLHNIMLSIVYVPPAMAPYVRYTPNAVLVP
jgi:hypothetical protein